MRRAHGFSFSKDIVFVDSSSSCDQGNSTVTFFFGASKIGGIPLGVVIYKHQTTNDYINAFTLLKKCLGDIAFNGYMYPSVFMTDDSAAERRALATVFKESKLLLCAFHVCQALWRWLWESKHKIEKSERQLKMISFRAVLFEQDESISRKGIEELCNDSNVIFSNHMISLKNRMTEWAVCFRKQLSIHGQNTNNIIESSIRIFKDIVLERCKTYNAAALVDFIFQVLKDYHKRRLIKYASYRVTKPQLQYNSLLSKTKDLKVTKINETKYTVSSSTTTDLVCDGYEYCECPAGIGGTSCKHICAIYSNGFIVENIPTLTTKNRIQLGNLAVGNTFDHAFMEPMETPQNIDYDNLMDKPNSQLTSNNKLYNEDNHNENIENQLVNSNDHLDVSNEVAKEINVLQNNIDTIKNLVSDNQNNIMVLKNMKQFNKLLGNIKSVSDFTDIFFNKFRRGKLIGTQPTSRTRWVRKISNGAKRIQAGRPSNIEKSIMVKKKQRVRCLGKNVTNNVPHTKSHWK